MTEIELKKQIDFWESIYNNCKSREDRELYSKIYSALNEVLIIWTKDDKFEK